MPDFVISTGTDGRPNVWPIGAISRDKHGVFRDFNNRVVKPPAVALDSATPAGVASADWLKDATESEIEALFKRRCKPASKASDALSADEHAMLVATLLLPTALRIMREEDKAARATDDKDSENHDLFNAGPEAEDGEEMPIENRAANWYAKARSYWQRVSTRTRQGSQLPGMMGRYSSPTAVKTRAAVAADAKRIEDPVAANARKARQFNLFNRF